MQFATTALGLALLIASVVSDDCYYKFDKRFVHGTFNVIQTVTQFQNEQAVTYDYEIGDGQWYADFEKDYFKATMDYWQWPTPGAKQYLFKNSSIGLLCYDYGVKPDLYCDRYEAFWIADGCVPKGATITYSSLRPLNDRTAKTYETKMEHSSASYSLITYNGRFLGEPTKFVLKDWSGVSTYTYTYLVKGSDTPRMSSFYREDIKDVPPSNVLD